MDVDEVSGDIAAIKSKVSGGEESAALCNGDVTEKANGVNGDNSRTDSVTIDDDDGKSDDSGDSNSDSDGESSGGVNGEEMNGERSKEVGDEKEDSVMEIDDESNDSGSSGPVKPSDDERSCDSTKKAAAKKSSVEDETSQDSLLSGDKSSKVNDDSDCEMIDDNENSNDKVKEKEESKTDEKKEVTSEKEEEKSKENDEAKEKVEGGEEKDKPPGQAEKKSEESEVEKKPDDQEKEEIKNESAKTNDSGATKDKESTSSLADLDPSQIETKAETAARLKAEEAKKAKFAVMDKPAEITDMRPMAHLLHNIGMDLCRETVYSHLIKVQNKKQSKKQLNDKETDQLEKLKEAHSEIKTKNKAFTMDTIKCPICIFRTESKNVLEWHLEFAHGQEDEIYSCSFCRFKTKMPGVFFYHMENEHKRKGRIYMRSAQFSCPLCPFENNKRPTMTKHRQRCEKVFSMKRNLEPSPTDCDIPLKKSKKQLAAAAAAAAPRVTRGAGVPQANIITRPQPPSLQPRPLGTSILNINPGGKATVAQTISHAIRPGAPASSNSIQLAAQAIAQQAAQNVLNQQRGQKTPIPLSGQIPGGMIPMYPPGTTQAQILAGTVRPTHYAIGNQLYQIVQARGQFMLQPVQSSASFQIRQATPVQPRPTAQQKAEIDLKSALEAVHKNVERKQAEEKRRKELAARAKAGGGAPQFEICEICGGFVKDRDSLHIHFFWAHKVEINKEVFQQQQPHLLCDICRSRFWTFQGLHRHRQISHGIGGSGGNKSIAPAPPRGQTYKCYMCGEQVAYLATHLSEKHNVSIQQMFKAKKCYVCGYEFDNQKALEKHLVKNHRELLTPQKFNPSPNKQTSPTPTGLFQNTGGRKSKTFTPECSICNIKFSSLEKFSQHCNDFHIFKCYRCGEKCATEELLQKHMFDSHRSDTDPCQICKQKVEITQFYLLPPANEVWGKVMFLLVCVILFRGVSAYGEVCIGGWADPPPSPRYMGCYWIRSTSGRYTSY